MHPTPFRRVAVFCGSGAGSDPRYVVQARSVGRELATRGIGIVYGGASVGCMGAVADAALGAGGEVLGVITRGLEAREVAHRGLTALEVVETMHERKARMATLADAVIALPGGYGTFDELFEALTWSQLQIDRKPIGVLDADGFWQPLLAMLDASVQAGFLREGNRRLVAEASTLDTLLDDMAGHMRDADRDVDRAVSVRP